MTTNECGFCGGTLPCLTHGAAQSSADSLVVPLEPTHAMVSAGMGEIPEDGSEYEDIERCYRAMIAACPCSGQITHAQETLISREAIARVIDPVAWEIGDRGFKFAAKFDREKSLEQADAVLTLLPYPRSGQMNEQAAAASILALYAARGYIGEDNNPRSNRVLQRIMNALDALASTPSPGENSDKSWTPAKFWEYAAALVGELEADQMRDRMQAVGLSIVSSTNGRQGDAL